jgi:glutaminase
LGGQWHVAMRATRAVEGSCGLWGAAFRFDFDFSVAPKSGACGGINRWL